MSTVRTIESDRENVIEADTEDSNILDMGIEDERLLHSQVINFPVEISRDPPPTYNEAVAGPHYEKVFIADVNTDDPPSYSELKLV